MEKEIIASISNVRGKHFAYGMMPAVTAAEVQFTKSIYTPNLNEDGEQQTPAYNVETEKFYILAVIHDMGRKYILSKKSYYGSMLFEFDPNEEDAAEYDENAEVIFEFETEDEAENPDFSDLDYTNFYELANHIANEIWMSN